MIAFGNTVLSDTDKRWRSVSREAHGIELARSAAVVSEWRVRSAQEERLVWSWYTVGGRVAATDYKAKALTAWAMLTGAGDHSTVTVLSTRLGGVGSDLLTSTVTPDQLEAARRRLTDQSARWPNELARFPLAQSSARTGSVSQ
jgi:EpsI family protein